MTVGPVCFPVCGELKSPSNILKIQCVAVCVFSSTLPSFVLLCLYNSLDTNLKRLSSAVKKDTAVNEICAFLPKMYLIHPNIVLGQVAAAKNWD